MQKPTEIIPCWENSQVTVANDKFNTKRNDTNPFADEIPKIRFIHFEIVPSLSFTTTTIVASILLNIDPHGVIYMRLL